MHEWELARRLAVRIRKEADGAGTAEVKEVRISLPAWECHDGGELIEALTVLLRGEPALLSARFTVVCEEPELHCRDCGWVLGSGVQPIGLKCPRCGSLRLEVRDSEMRVSLVT